jgi:hypothetical protein
MHRNGTQRRRGAEQRQEKAAGFSPFFGSDFLFPASLRLCVKILCAFLGLFLLAACTPAVNVAPTQPAATQLAMATAVAATLTASAPPSTPSATPASARSATPAGPSATPAPSLTPTVDLMRYTPAANRATPQAWNTWAVYPSLSARAREIYRQGIARGNDARAFGAIGDCQSEPAVFLGIYDTERYRLAKEDAALQETIDFYKGVFGRQSLAVRDGLSAPSALSVQWADASKCQANENPVQCELRVHRPSIVFVNLGTNWRADASTAAYEKYLRQIVDLLIANGSVPVLSTKADNVEGGNRINEATMRVAYDYDIPLWNFWVTAQYLPNHGLDPDRKDVYLSVEAWDARSYGALKVLDHLRRELLTVYDPSTPSH